MATIDAGDQTAEVAEVFAVSPAWVRRLVQRRRETGEVAPRTARDPDHVWVADIIYVRVWAEFVYLAVLLDVFTRYDKKARNFLGFVWVACLDILLA